MRKYFLLILAVSFASCATSPKRVGLGESAFDIVAKYGKPDQVETFQDADLWTYRVKDQNCRFFMDNHGTTVTKAACTNAPVVYVESAEPQSGGSSFLRILGAAAAIGDSNRQQQQLNSIDNGVRQINSRRGGINSY